jgi:hypothetical protein
MRIVIDTVEKTLTADSQRLDLYGKEAFELVSELWLKTGWNQKYSYTFTWLGRPVIQHPEDLVRLQEAIFTLRPNVIVETGVAHGGSLIFCASLFKAMGTEGRAIGIDIELRPQNRKAIESHELASYVALIEGDSASSEVVARVHELVRPGDKVMVILDSSHAKAPRSQRTRGLRAAGAAHTSSRPTVSWGWYTILLGARRNGILTIPPRPRANLRRAIPSSSSRSRNGGSMKVVSTERSRLGPAAGSNESNERLEAESGTPLAMRVHRALWSPFPLDWLSAERCHEANRRGQCVIDAAQ